MGPVSSGCGANWAPQTATIDTFRRSKCSMQSGHLLRFYELESLKKLRMRSCFSVRV